MVQENIKREAEIEKFITYRTWKKYMVFLEGPHGKVRQSTGRQRDMPLLKSMGGMLWSFWAKP